MTDQPVNAYAEYKPTLWQRIAWWHRWPWHPTMVPFDQRVYGTQPYLVTVRESGALIGWHPVERPTGGTYVIPGRWTCLLGLIRPPHFEVEVSKDPEWRPPTEGE